MNKILGYMAAALFFFSAQGLAADRITKEQIQAVIEASDLASMNRDTAGIGKYLGSRFYKYVDLPDTKPPLAVELNKAQYLAQIDKGWDKLEKYDYERKDIVINVAPDGQTAESYSTVTESFTIDGKDMVSKVREYAKYELEDGRPVIIQIESHTLVGDTTP